MTAKSSASGVSVADTPGGPADARRRQFMQAAAAVGGTVLVGLTVPAFGGRQKPGAVAAASQLNAWLAIGADNQVTIIVDRCEMGQGVYTALPMLLAEELEIAVDAVRVVAAPVGEAYSNKLNGGQVTGTSNSVQDAWESLKWPNRLSTG